MKTFHCNRCAQLVFFENVRCERCGALLGYLPDLAEISAFEPEGDPAQTELWRSLHPLAQGRLYRMCGNYALENVCNWMVPADAPHRLCRSCELTTVIPNLAPPENHLRWYKLETAKRRLLYTLAALRLPIEPKRAAPAALEPLPEAAADDDRAQDPADPGGPIVNEVNPSPANPAPMPLPLANPMPMDPPQTTPAQAFATPANPTTDASAPGDACLPPALPPQDSDDGVTFEFLEDTPEGERVLTGHDNGRITLNIAEADDAHRETVREQMHEPYRTLLGHFRHEIGHYYFDQLVAGTRWNAPFRERFGDEREDYAEALQRHYDEGPPAEWRQSYISAYASTHPWEDWAETWAHYLHMVDTLDTASSCGLALLPDDPREPTLNDTTPVEDAGFDNLMKRWYPLTYALNSMNRSLGLPDGYPFTLPPAVVEKLRFVHRVVAAGVQPKLDAAPAAEAGNNPVPPPHLEREMLDS